MSDPSSDAHGGREDARVVRTRAALAEALLELVPERGFDALTVRDITARAGVGYATFFRHYPGKEALLEEVLETTLAELKALLEPLSADADPAETGARVFHHAAEHPARYRTLLQSQRAVPLLPRALEVASAGIAQSFAPRADAEVPLDLAAAHLTRSFVALIEWWLDRDAPPPPEVMGRIYRELIFEPVRRVALAPREADPEVADRLEAQN